MICDSAICEMVARDPARADARERVSAARRMMRVRDRRGPACHERLKQLRTVSPGWMNSVSAWGGVRPYALANPSGGSALFEPGWRAAATAAFVALSATDSPCSTRFGDLLDPTK
jgi:hypothetical protein